MKQEGARREDEGQGSTHTTLWEEQEEPPAAATLGSYRQIWLGPVYRFEAGQS